MIRKAAVAGAFYPAEAETIRQSAGEYLKKATLHKYEDLRGLIVPHAGYIYSGPTAGFGYKQLSNLPESKYNVFILGPAHYIFTTASVGRFDSYETPLGAVRVNRDLCNELLKHPDIEFYPQAHTREHSLEVQLPFLQLCLKDFEIVPIVLGEASPDRLAEILSPYFLKKENLFIFSSDLSHYKPYEEAVSTDQKSLEIIRTLDLARDNQIDACGKIPIQTAMRLAKKNHGRIEMLDYRNSGDTAGDKGEVVGYSALAIIK